MIKSLFARLRPTPTLFTLLEAGLIGVFFVQALRFLVGMIYARTAGASTVLALQAIGADLPAAAPDPTIVQNEVVFLVYALALPLIAIIFGRWRGLIFVAAAITAAGRALMFEGTGLGFSPVQAAALTVGGGLLYSAVIIRHRIGLFPVGIVLGLVVDQLLRAAGNTYDLSWSAAYQPVQIGLSSATLIISLIGLLWSARRPVTATDHGALPFWGGFGIGGLLFIQLSLLAVPNAIGGRAGALDQYALLVPLTLAATILPLVPAVRGWARGFIGVFDGNLRGWLWLLLTVLLIVIGTRINGLIAVAALVLAQFILTLVWWWLARPRGQREWGLAGLWLVIGALIFALLAAMDTFTYEYAFVRDFTGDAAFLNQFVTPLLRGFRGFGLGVILLAVFFAILPMTQNPRRIPWQGGSSAVSIVTILIGAAAVGASAVIAQPPVVTATFNVTDMRVGTYNIHSGTDEFFTPTLPQIATTILESGANVVLLQEVEAGRITGFGVDQSLWLARRLGMDRRFFATNEGLHGLAVLSNIPIAFNDGQLLGGIGQQTGVQRVQILTAPDVGVTVYNTWLGYLFETDETLVEQEQDQQRQLGQIITWIDTHFPNRAWGRLIVGGTFNNVPDSPLITGLRTFGFRDPSDGLPLELAATLVRSGLPRARFDYLWLYNVESLGPFTMPNPASDHRMTGAGVRLVTGN